MSFIASNITTIGGQTKRGLQSLGYVSATDDLATVSAAGYFNDYREYMTKGDVITYINSADNTISELRITVLGIAGDVETVILSQTAGYTGDLFDSAYYKIADVVNGLIVSVEYLLQGAILQENGGAIFCENGDVLAW